MNNVFRECIVGIATGQSVYEEVSYTRIIRISFIHEMLSQLIQDIGAKNEQNLPKPIFKLSNLHEFL